MYIAIEISTRFSCSYVHQNGHLALAFKLDLDEGIAMVLSSFKHMPLYE